MCVYVRSVARDLRMRSIRSGKGGGQKKRKDKGAQPQTLASVPTPMYSGPAPVVTLSPRATDDPDDYDSMQVSMSSNPKRKASKKAAPTTSRRTPPAPLPPTAMARPTSTSEMLRSSTPRAPRVSSSELDEANATCSEAASIAATAALRALKRSWPFKLGLFLGIGLVCAAIFAPLKEVQRMLLVGLAAIAFSASMIGYYNAWLGVRRDVEYELLEVEADDDESTSTATGETGFGSWFGGFFSDD